VAKVPVPPQLSLDGPWSERVRRMFEKYDLDPGDLRHWHGLLFLLAGTRKGAKLKWDAWELCKLRALVEMMQHVDPKKKDTKCCEDISKNDGTFRLHKGDSNKGYFEGVKPGTLRRKLQEARKPKMRQAYENFWDILGRSNAES
jgi:hypothetical protein